MFFLCYEQPNNPTTQQPNNPTTQQPNNPTTQQPNNLKHFCLKVSFFAIVVFSSISSVFAQNGLVNANAPYFEYFYDAAGNRILRQVQPTAIKSKEETPPDKQQKDIAVALVSKNIVPDSSPTNSIVNTKNQPFISNLERNNKESSFETNKATLTSSLSGNLPEDLRFTVYPNPVNRFLTVSGGISNFYYTLIITDMLGQIVFQKLYVDGITIDKSEIGAVGTYSIAIYTKKGEIAHSSKIIIK